MTDERILYRFHTRCPGGLWIHTHTHVVLEGCVYTHTRARGPGGLRDSRYALRPDTQETPPTTHTHTRTHTHTHTDTDRHTHTHTHTNTHTSTINWPKM